MSKADVMLIVDDNYIVRLMLEQQFRDDFEIVCAENGADAVTAALKNKEHLVAILLDLYMPVMDGYQVLDKLSRFGITEKVPIFIVTIENSSDKIQTVFNLGAVDIIEKPFNPITSRRRIMNTIELYAYRNRQKILLDGKNGYENQHINKSIDITVNICETLSSVIEFRGFEGEGHINRIKRITKMLTARIAERNKEYKLSNHDIELISEASVLHDIGKITIPDSILNKPDRLTADEFDIVKTHTVKGCEIIDSMTEIKNSEFYKYCYDICRYHHERVDGRGYPDRLVGNSIPIWSQIVSVVDVYDSLVSKRCYKSAIQHSRAVDMIMNGECGAFDSRIMVVFMEMSDEIMRIYREF